MIGYPTGSSIMDSAHKSRAINTNQIYASTHAATQNSEMKKSNNGITNVVKSTKSSKVNVKKPSNTGLMPRGNTLDYRCNQLSGVIGSNVVPATAASSHAVASHTSTVGVSSQNGSRPESAIKKKSTVTSSGLSPHSKMLKFNDKF